MANTLDTIYTMWLRELKRFVKSRSRVLGTGGQPLIWLAIIGVGFGSALGVGALVGGVPYITFMAPGIIGMTILFSSIFAGINVIFDKQFGFMKEILVAPVSRVGIVLGKISGSATVSLISAGVVLIIVVAVGIIPLGMLTVLGVIESIVFMVLTAAIFVSVGLVIASSINNIEGFQVIINFFILPLFFLSGALFPLTEAPAWMAAISSIDPLRYSVDGMRGALLGAKAATYPVAVDFAVVLGVAIVLVIIADFAFRKMQGK
jgi:ABC-2 type transport system permease protein